MSHNEIKVNNVKPDVTGNISLSLSNISDINISSVANQNVLKFDSSNWVNVLRSATFETTGYAAGWSTYSGGSATNSYTSTGTLNSYRTHDVTDWEDTNSDVQITSGGLDLDRGSEGGVIPTQTRFSRIVLDEGKYLLIGQTMARSSTSANWVEFQWQDISTSAVLGPRWRQYGSAAKEIGRGVGYVEVGSGATRTVDIRVVAHNGTMYDNPHNVKDDILMAIQVG